ncbi:hypothetical protein MMC07_007081 [Pseudocyphellaria aurata]|nr:hypothetical protein [Pseudocyphellaria aurata]
MAEAANNHGPTPVSTMASTTASSSQERPAVLIVGGLGYIGRFLALHIHKNNLASEVRLVDKVLPQLAHLAPEFSDACSSVKFMQADATREQSLSKIFTLSSGREFSYVFNCGGETRYSQDDSVYSARSLELSLALGRECARRKTPALIEFGSGMIYKSPSSSTISSGGCKESAPLKPWLKIAKYKLRAEEGLEKLARENGLCYAVLRLAHVYGPYDVGYLARGLCLARVYQSQNREMKWLWGKDLRVNTVHVWDVCHAAWLAAGWCARTSHAAAPVRAFNIADKGDTSQGTLATIFGSIFNIPTGFQGTLVSSFARFNLDSVVDDVNEDILQPWADLLKDKNITKPGPLSPFMEKELLKDCDLCLDAGRAAEVLGWEVDPAREAVGEGAVREVVESYERMGWWP